MNNRKLWVSIIAGLLAAVMLLSMIISLIPTRANAASSSEIKKQINALKNQKSDLQQQMEDVQSQFEHNEDEIVNMVNQKNVIDQEIFLLHGQIENINQQLTAYSLLIADKQDELDAASAKMAALNAKNIERIRAMEEDGNISYWAVLFRANSFSDLLDRLNMIEEIAAADQQRLREMDEAARKVAAAQAELADEKDELAATKDELDAAHAKLDEKLQEAEELLADLIANGIELEALYAEYEQAELELLDEIALKEQEYIEAKELEYIAYMATYTTAPPPTTQPPATKPADNPENGSAQAPGDAETAPDASEGTEATTPPTEAPKPQKESWIVPCSYRMLTSPFGNRERPTAGASSDHKGVDLAGPEGTPIYASRSGVVTAATYGKSAGYYVTINHGDGYASIYMHMTHYVVSKGQEVSQGQLIGYMGATGITTGSHLHFGIIQNGSYVNPANYVYLHA